MARKRSSRISYAAVKRSAVDLGYSVPERVVVSPARLGLLQLLEDRRTWHPAGSLRPFATIGPRSQRRLVVKSTPAALRNDISSRVGFAVPKKVAVCVRRKQRREVLHAMGKAGGSVSRRRRRNDYSNIDC